MDLVTAATTYTSIVGLICNFKREKKSQADQSRDQFMAWLVERKHEDLKEFILRSQEIPSEIELLLKQDTGSILSRLDDMRSVLSELPDGIKAVAAAITGSSSRSDRISLLFRLVGETEAEAQRLELSGLFVPRQHADTRWPVPVDVHALRLASAKFGNMYVADVQHFSFLIKEDAFGRETMEVDCFDRLAKRVALLKAMERLIALREEVDQLELATQTR